MCSLVTILVNNYNILIIFNKTYKVEISHFCHKLRTSHLKCSSSMIIKKKKRYLSSFLSYFNQIKKLRFSFHLFSYSKICIHIGLVLGWARLSKLHSGADSSPTWGDWALPRHQDIKWQKGLQIPSLARVMEGISLE